MRNLREILEKIQKQQISLEEAEKLLKLDYIETLDNYAQLDLRRDHRTGIPEVIFAETKDIENLSAITFKLLEKKHFALLSRVSPDQAQALQAKLEENNGWIFEYHRQGRIFVAWDQEFENMKAGLPIFEGKVGLISAGTSDLPVAEEARWMLHYMGYPPIISYDIGIAGMHRLFRPLMEMISAGVKVIIVVAGMEGTLPGVIASLVDVPVIGVPTSTGYGLGAKGIGALTTMLQSCAPGLAVVNIDNGFGAAVYASLILKQIN